ncbi:MAG: TIGR00730 family Rossman fold protein [Pseudomonadota bacterium]
MTQSKTIELHPLQQNVPVPRTIKTVCVYCGSGHGTDPAYKAAAITLGTDLAKAGMGLVYGGGSLGLMGEVARATMRNGGPVTGIIPQFLTEHEKMLKDADQVVVTKDMHERKMLMFERSDAFVALPGGIGTLEELVEQLTWAQLGQHGKPIVIVNIKGFWDPFLSLLDHMRAQAFIRANLDVGYQVVQDAGDVVPALQTISELAAQAGDEARTKVADTAISEKF